MLIKNFCFPWLFWDRTGRNEQTHGDLEIRTYKLFKKILFKQISNWWAHIHSCLSTLRCLINVRVLINVRGGKFWKNNKRTGPNKSTGQKKPLITLWIHCNFCKNEPWFWSWLKSNNRRVPNTKVLVEKNFEINKRTAHVY